MSKLIKPISWLVMASPLAYLAFIWEQAPARVAIYFGLNGVPDRMGDKNDLLILVLVLVAVNALAFLLMSNIKRLSPKLNSDDNNSRFLRIGLAIAVFITVVLFIIINASIHGDMRTGIRFIFAGTGLLLCIIGNYMYTIKPNYYAGIRLPWTLKDDENWRRTHLLGGKLFFAGGLLIAALCLLVPAHLSVLVFGIITAIIILVPCIYSYRLHKKTANH